MRLPDRYMGLSDLFFNYEHPKYDAAVRDVTAYEGVKPTDTGVPKRVHDALVDDAQDFLDTYRMAVGETTGVGLEMHVAPDSVQLAADFLARL